MSKIKLTVWDFGKYHLASLSYKGWRMDIETVGYPTAREQKDFIESFMKQYKSITDE